MGKTRNQAALKITAMALTGFLVIQARAAEPPAEAIRAALASGVDFTQPVTVKFEWKPTAPHPNEDAVRLALQSEGFAWARTESRESVQSAVKVSISATRTGPQAPNRLSATMKEVSNLANGQGTKSWHITQQR